MNKTVTINISGIIFHIEEDAYDKLSRYLSTIKGYFKESEGRDEIITDIEARIAEMLQERVSTVKQVVLMTDVDHVISVMGRPEEFAGEGNGGEKQPEEQTSSTYTGRRHRVFRDPDDKIIGGVCSGVGHYFGIDPLWLRLTLGISFFVFGFGLLFYILLWIIIPKARTTAEKLEMRGETVNVNNIHRTFTESMDDLKEKMKDFKKEASDLGSKEHKEKMKQGLSRFGMFVEEFFHMLGMGLGKFFAVIFTIAGILLLIGLLASIFGYHSIFSFGIHSGGVNTSIRDLNAILFAGENTFALAVVAVVLLLGVPFLMLIYSGIRVLFGLGRSNKVLRILSSLLWASGIVLAIIVIYELNGDFSEIGQDKRISSVKPNATALYIRMSDPDKSTEDALYSSHHHRWAVPAIKDHKVCNFYPELDIVRSQKDSFQITVFTTAHGSSEKEANVRARNIQYHFSAKDSVLELDPSYFFDVKDHWRKQEVRVVVAVPVSKVIYLNQNLRRLVQNSDIDNVQRTRDEDMVGRRWIMTEEGLNCVDCYGLDMIHHAPAPPAAPEPPSAVKEQVKKAGFFAW